MALLDNDKLGKWLDTYNFNARIFGGKKYATQSTGDGGFIVRGRGIVNNIDFVKDAGLEPAEILELEPSDDYGVQTPLSFVAPEGYTEVKKGTTIVYYPNSLLDANPSLANPVSGITTTATRSADTMFTKIWAWIQANPLQAAIIFFVIYVFIIEPLLLKKKGKKSLLGKLF